MRVRFKFWLWSRRSNWTFVGLSFQWVTTVCQTHSKQFITMRMPWRPSFSPYSLKNRQGYCKDGALLRKETNISGVKVKAGPVVHTLKGQRSSSSFRQSETVKGARGRKRASCMKLWAERTVASSPPSSASHSPFLQGQWARCPIGGDGNHFWSPRWMGCLWPWICLPVPGRERWGWDTGRTCPSWHLHCSTVHAPENVPDAEAQKSTGTWTSTPRGARAGQLEAEEPVWFRWKSDSSRVPLRTASPLTRCQGPVPRSRARRCGRACEHRPHSDPNAQAAHCGALPRRSSPRRGKGRRERGPPHIKGEAEIFMRLSTPTPDTSTLSLSERDWTWQRWTQMAFRETHSQQTESLVETQGGGFLLKNNDFFLLLTPHKLRLLNQNIYVFLKSQLLPFPTVKLLSSTQGLTLGRVTGSMQMPAL